MTGSIAGGDGVGEGGTIDIDGGESGDDGAIGRIFSDGGLSVREVWSLVHIGDGNGQDRLIVEVTIGDLDGERICIIGFKVDGAGDGDDSGVGVDCKVTSSITGGDGVADVAPASTSVPARVVTMVPLAEFSATVA